MVQKLLVLMAALGLSVIVLSQSGTLSGEVTDASTGEPIPFANITILENDNIVNGGTSDFDGRFNIRPIPAGTYDVSVSYMGYNSIQLNNIQIPAGRMTIENFKLTPAAEILDEVEIREYRVPLISADQTESGATITSEDIERMPGRSAAAVATTVGGVYSEDGEVGSIRGARSEGTVYFIDGIRVRGTSAVPQSAIQEVQVITGGLSANYGDATGGVISITTRGPSSKFYGSGELITSQFLDAYGYNMGGLSLSGPIWTIEEPGTERTRTVAGFLFSGEVSHRQDSRPSAVGAWVADSDVIEDIRNEPLVIRQTLSGPIHYQRADFLRDENFENIKRRNNASSLGVNLAGRLDFQPVRDFNVSFGGTMDYRDMDIYSFGNQLFNYENNGRQKYNNWRMFGRITQIFRTDKESESLLRNPYYRIQVDYTQTLSSTFDKRFEDNFFEYGYVGKFETTPEKFYMWGHDTVTGLDGWIEETYFYRIEDFEQGTLNPDLARYTEQYWEHFGDRYYIDRNSIMARGGLLNGMTAPSIYGIWTSPGNPYGGYTKSNTQQFRVSAMGSADIKGHEISIGFEFEQRNDSYFGLAPVGLWGLARQYMNFHILEKDLANPYLVYDENGIYQDTIYYDRLYNSSAHNTFDRNFRKAHDIPEKGLDWIDIDSYDPDDFDLSMFSADELFNQGYNLVTYYGYDHAGNRLNYKPTLEDFFNKTNEDGVRTRPIAPFEPNYMAGYIMDRFAFRDLIFNIGLRIDRYDANQKVLKDRYLFSDAYRVGDIDEKGLIEQFEHPANIPDGAVIYVDDVENPTTINGYRVENTWYNRAGTEIENPRLIHGQTGISPYLIDSREELHLNAFEDYKPQIDVSPRIAFSFPISDVALFSAHYNILSKRPTYSARLNPIEYYHIRVKNNDMINNPNLQTEKTIDYELGFQQRLGNTSALKISAFYREMRDMQQTVAVVGAYPVNYYSYGNIDFGTVKGFTAAYDLRRTGNVAMRASYTLQFAYGTGSSFESARTIVRSDKPNLRTTLPLDFDQRHSFVINLDYRYGGKANRTPYDGPKLFGRNIFANTGANFVINSGSGSPYTQRDRPEGGTVVGSINSARKPWRTNINVRINRDIRIMLSDGKEKGESEKYANLNIYVEISNLLNTKNVINVYSYTGNPDDNGYLNFSDYQTSIATQNDEEAYRNYYAMYLNNPYNYSLPRVIRLGAVFSF